MTDMRYIYHPKLGTKLLTVEESDPYYPLGWYDTPAKFPAVVNKERFLDKLMEENKPTEYLDSANPEQHLIRKRGRPPRGIA